jgi:hypothetical protein
MLRAQNVNLIPEKVWAEPSVEWQAHGTAFYNYQGELFVATYTPSKVQTFPSEFAAYPYFYTCSANEGATSLTKYQFGIKKSNTVSFGFPGEEGAAHEPKIMGQNFFFEFNGQLWYFQCVHSNLYYGSGGLVDEGFKCFAQIPSNTNNEATHFYTDHKPAPWYYPMGAFQFDSLLYFLSIDQKSGSSTYGKWYLEEFGYNSTTKTFFQTRSIQMPAIRGDRLGGVIARKGVNGSMLIVSTFSSTSYSSYLGMLQVSNLNNAFQFTYTSSNVSTLSNIASVALVPGSIKGSRTSGVAPDQYPSLSERIVTYGMNKSTNSDGQYHIPYCEYLVSNDNLQLVHLGEMTLPSGKFPHKISGEFDIRGAVGMQLASFNNYLPGNDGYQQWSWCFYPLSNDKIGGATTMSDMWQMIPGSLISSTDLAHDMDTAYGKSIRSLWNLVGIIDGAPPAVIDWTVWDALHTFEYKPSEIKFVTTQISDTSTAVTGEFGASFTRGSDISMEGEKLSMEFGNEIKYSGGFEKKVELSTSWKQEYTLPFELDKETQEYGTYIWAIPEIDRVSYQVFPWWDMESKYPKYNTLQYLFRIAGMALYTESVKLEEEPFGIQHPTANNLAYWKQDYRYDLYSSTKLNNISHINISWTDNNHGSNNYLRRGRDSTSTTSWNIGYANEYTVGVKIPKVFSFNIAVGAEIKYSAETKIRTFFGNSIEASYRNMWHKSEGINMNFVNTNIYTLKPEDNVPYWYYNYVEGQRPWYIAYLVGDCYDQINTMYPANGSCVGSITTPFTWNTSLGELRDFRFYITGSQRVSPPNILFMKETGNQMSADLSGFIPEKGKTYFWVVRGIGPNGDLVWSEPQSIRFSCEPESGNGQKSISATILPNPGDCSELRLVVEPSGDQSPITIRLTDMQGNNLTTAVPVKSGSSMLSAAFPGLSLAPGIYLAVISQGELKTVKKVVVR